MRNADGSQDADQPLAAFGRARDTSDHLARVADPSWFGLAARQVQCTSRGVGDVVVCTLRVINPVASRRRRTALQVGKLRNQFLVVEKSRPAGREKR